MADIVRNEDGKLDAYAWPGGYPIYYLAADNGVFCPACANGENRSDAYTGEHPDGSGEHDKQWQLVACDINYENNDLTCDHCNKKIDAAYEKLTVVLAKPKTKLGLK